MHAHPERPARVWECGYAVDDMEDELGIRCVAPAFVHSGAVVIAISVSGPVFRVTPDHLAELSEAVHRNGPVLRRPPGRNRSAIAVGRRYQMSAKGLLWTSARFMPPR
ncbi:IclR family transcriptional regulator C-terminal domain-containing protein [Streptomyces sp. NPDC093085]|uniref:IclR family transcriptional regulator domain-containing protein n=1 Tax=Streptomyces sp. NPDC093085 TaxID=3155068 RepID=UPI0034193AFD